MLFYGTTRLLIVEDEEMFRTLLARYCQIWGYAVVATCSNGRDAIVQAVRLKPEMALVDLDIPIYSGLEVASALRKKVPETKIMVITAEATPSNVRLARQIGVDGILDKTSDTFDRIGEVLPTMLQGKRYYSPSVAKIIAAAEANTMVSESAL